MSGYASVLFHAPLTLPQSCPTRIIVIGEYSVAPAVSARGPSTSFEAQILSATHFDLEYPRGEASVGLKLKLSDIGASVTLAADTAAIEETNTK
jgi:hypothetical protein